MRFHEHIALGAPTVLLPAENIDLTRWAVIACDQFTSEPDYWEAVRRFVGGAPSTLNLIFPEAFLGQPDEEARIASIRAAMKDYLGRGVFRRAEGFVYVERRVGRGTRRGLLAALDLDAYDYSSNSTSLVRATEGTILERIPPRVKIREGAPLELPHIMVLIDDPQDTVIGSLAASRSRLEVLYDFELMMDSGRLAGYRVGDRALEEAAVKALKKLADPGNFRSRHGLSGGHPVLLFAMGDGNHSLATAKFLWEKTKKESPDMAPTSPLRHALVEMVNLHDPALVFEPIHRVIFGLDAGRDPVKEWTLAASTGAVAFDRLSSFEEMRNRVDVRDRESQRIGIIREDGFGILEFKEPSSQLAVGTFQPLLDRFLKTGGAREADYVHGAETAASLGRRPGNAGFYLPAMAKQDLFRTIILDGVLPRKTFSMGEAREKRFYMEARKIS